MSNKTEARNVGTNNHVRSIRTRNILKAIFTAPKHEYGRDSYPTIYDAWDDRYPTGKRTVRKLTLFALALAIPTSSNTVVAENIGHGINVAAVATHKFLDSALAAYAGEVPTTSLEVRAAYDKHHYAFPGNASSITIGKKTSSVAGIRVDTIISKNLRAAPLWNNPTFFFPDNGSLVDGSIRHLQNMSPVSADLDSADDYSISPGTCSNFWVSNASPGTVVRAIDTSSKAEGLVFSQTTANNLEFCNNTLKPMSNVVLDGLYLQFDNKK